MAVVDVDEVDDDDDDVLVFCCSTPLSLRWLGGVCCVAFVFASFGMFVAVVVVVADDDVVVVVGNSKFSILFVGGVGTAPSPEPPPESLIFTICPSEKDMKKLIS